MELDASEVENDSVLDVCLTLNSDGQLETSLVVTLLAVDGSAGKIFQSYVHARTYLTYNT